MCGNEFEAKTIKKKYCSRACEAKLWRKTKGLNKLKDGRFCRQCGKHFYPQGRGGNNKQHCSSDCSRKSARESRSNFWLKQKDPKAKRANYDKKTREKVGPDGNLIRFYKRYPNGPKICESCGETRVLDVAHKPGHERNGSWRSLDNTKWPQKVWILCPTCHALIDRMNYSPEELGLSR